MDERSLFGHDVSEIHNIIEDLVIELLEKILNEDKTKCRCQLCIEDMYALSLNMIQPRYIQHIPNQSAFLGPDKTKTIDKEKMEMAVRNAVSKVCKNPSH